MEITFANPEINKQSANESRPDPATTAALRFQDICQLHPEDRQSLDLAFADMVNLTYPMLYNELVRRGANEDDAQEVLQITYLKTLNSLAEGKFEGRSKVSTWLFRGMLNNFYDLRTSQAKRGNREISNDMFENHEIPDSTDVEGMVIDKLETKQLADKIVQLFDELGISSRDQKVVFLRSRGMHYTEIAAILGISSALAAKVIVHRVRTKVRTELSSSS
jgi:RNA polymerase sigma factor (sigma-70 family)